MGTSYRQSMAEDAQRRRSPEDSMMFCARLLEFTLDWVMRIVGPILICVATFLICAVVHIFFSTVVYFVATPWTASYVLHSSIVIWITGNILFNYFACVCTRPGYAPTEQELLDRVRDGEEISERQKLTLLKPPRSHHCQISRRQVLRMDHFCPWVGNCVGFHNYRFFFLFLTYMAVGCWYGVLICLAPFHQCVHHRVSTRTNPICQSKAHITFAFIITLSVGIAVGLMLAFHVYLVLSAQTTIEFYFNKFSGKGKRHRGELFMNQYDLGRTKNWHAVFGVGAYWWSWALPSLASPPGDGIEYMTRSDSLRQKRAEMASLVTRGPDESV